MIDRATLIVLALLALAGVAMFAMPSAVGGFLFAAFLVWVFA